MQPSANVPLELPCRLPRCPGWCNQSGRASTNASRRSCGQHTDLQVANPMDPTAKHFMRWWHSACQAGPGQTNTNHRRKDTDNIPTPKLLQLIAQPC
jgi:hypothetical protein